jgi:hypothetical protein
VQASGDFLRPSTLLKPNAVHDVRSCSWHHATDSQAPGVFSNSFR